ncbi:MAG TPA: hypothetical protein VF407_23700 [Polyangiaceae bacterium]
MIGPRSVVAPGKLLVTGAYAVLEGAPAVVIAVDRHARAEIGKKPERVSAEVAEALGDKAMFCDSSALYEGEKKLGLGSSAAVLVASLGADWIARGNALDDDGRSRIFFRARDVHARVQNGGSGFDLAASTYGGCIRYTLHGGKPWMTSLELPFTLEWHAYFSGESARTSDLRAQVDAFKAKDRAAYDAVIKKLGDASELSANSFLEGSGRAIVDSARLFAEALEQLAEEADAPIVPLAFRRLSTVATAQNAVFYPSGAGGGDIGLYLGTTPPTDEFEQRAAQLGMKKLDLKLDTQGVRRQIAALAPSGAPSEPN